MRYCVGYCIGCCVDAMLCSELYGSVYRGRPSYFLYRCRGTIRRMATTIGYAKLEGGSQWLAAGTRWCCGQRCAGPGIVRNATVSIPVATMDLAGKTP